MYHSVHIHTNTDQYTPYMPTYTKNYSSTDKYIQMHTMHTNTYHEIQYPKLTNTLTSLRMMMMITSLMKKLWHGQLPSPFQIMYNFGNTKIYLLATQLYR